MYIHYIHLYKSIILVILTIEKDPEKFLQMIVRGIRNYSEMQVHIFKE